MALPAARPPHAEPSDEAYHVYCGGCRRWVGGAYLARGGIFCPNCRRVEPVVVDVNLVLSDGRYAGRRIRAMHTLAELDYLDSLLHSGLGRPGGAPEQAVRLAVLRQLGWLDAARQQVVAGPNLPRYEQAWASSQAENLTAPGAGPDERERAAGNGSWQRTLQAAWNSLRAREAPFTRQQQQHQTDQYEDIKNWRQSQQQAKVPPLTGPVAAAGQPGLIQLPVPAVWWALELGLAGRASAQTIGLAYRQQSKKAHPDAGGSVVRMQHLNAARQAALAWFRQAG